MKRKMSEGPDRILPADSFHITDRYSPVKLRITEEKDDQPDSLKPISVPSLLERAAKTAGDEVTALAVKRQGTWVTWNYSQYLEDVRTTAKAFIKLGLEARMGVGIIGFNAPEWFFSDLGAVFANGIATGIYATNSAATCKHIAISCQANIIVADDSKQVSKFLSIKDELPDLRAIVQYLGKPEMDAKNAGVLSWEELMEIGRKESDEQLEKRLKDIAINSCCHLVYTSGTTGPPKGVMLSHDNLTFTAKMLAENYRLRDKKETLVSFLPLSHVAANTTDIILWILAMGTIYFAQPDALKGSLVTTLKEIEPTAFLAVPRVYEKMYEKMMDVAKTTQGFKKSIGDWAKATALDHNQRQLENLNEELPKSWSFALADYLVFQKVKEALGLRRCTRIVSAAAPLSPRMMEYFMSLDIKIWEIYGMSECSGPQLNNSFDCWRIGTIGKSINGFHTKVSDQIYIRGRNVFMGYLDNPEANAEAFDDEGWLRSGDLGEVDEDGYVRITGRIKEIIITAGGENVAPALIEEQVKKALPCINNITVVGDKRKFLTCLLTFKTLVDPETLEPSRTLDNSVIEWIEDEYKKRGDNLSEPLTTVEAAESDPIVQAAIENGILEANKQAVSNAQRVQKFKILDKDFSIPGGELGPTLKIKRYVVAEKYEKEINTMYE